MYLLKLCNINQRPPTQKLLSVINRVEASLQIEKIQIHVSTRPWTSEELNIVTVILTWGNAISQIFLQILARSDIKISSSWSICRAAPHMWAIPGGENHQIRPENVTFLKKKQKNNLPTPLSASDNHQEWRTQLSHYCCPIFYIANFLNTGK